MKKNYSLEDLKRIIRKDNFNFFAVAITPLQAIGIDAAIEYLTDKNINPFGVIYTISHGKTGKHVTKDDFCNLKKGLVCFDGEVDYSIIAHLKEYLIIRFKKNNNLNTVYIVCVEVMPYVAYEIEKMGYKCIFILIDDGAGSYFNKFISVLKANYNSFKDQKKLKRVSLFLKAVIKGILLVDYERYLHRQKKCLDFRLFSFHNKTVIRNHLSTKYYYNVLKKQSINKTEDYSIFEESILINTQCFKECNITDGIVDYNVYKQVIDSVKNTKYNVLLKPHPRELNIDKYKNLECTLINNTKQSQEIILAGLEKRPRCIISVCSSTLLNAAGLFNIPSISLAKIMLKHKINSSFRSTLNSYIKMYKNVLFFPESIDELKRYIIEGNYES